MEQFSAALIRLEIDEAERIRSWAAAAWQIVEHIEYGQHDPDFKDYSILKALHSRLQAGGVMITVAQWTLFFEANDHRPEYLAEHFKRHSAPKNLASPDWVSDTRSPK